MAQPSLSGRVKRNRTSDVRGFQLRRPRRAGCGGTTHHRRRRRLLPLPRPMHPPTVHIHTCYMYTYLLAALLPSSSCYFCSEWQVASFSIHRGLLQLGISFFTIVFSSTGDSPIWKETFFII